MGYCDSSAHDSRDGGILAAGGRTGEIDSAHTVAVHSDSGGESRRSAGAWVLLALVQFYRVFLSHFLGGACKFDPVPDREEGKTSGMQIPHATHSSAVSSFQTLKARFTENAPRKQDKELLL